MNIQLNSVLFSKFSWVLGFFYILNYKFTIKMTEITSEGACR